MIVIYGESNSGKTDKSISLLDFSKKILYFSLDFDKKVKEIELKLPNIRVEAFYKRKVYLSDIESIIIEYGGVISNYLSYVVIDPINFIKFDNKSIKYKLSKIKEIEDKYKNKFEIIVTINKLIHFELEDIEDDLYEIIKL